MTSKFCFELDKKGILPFWFESESLYLHRGEDLIKKYEHFDLEDAFKKATANRKYSRYKSYGLVEKEKIEKEAKSVLEAYGYDLSWVNGVYFKDTCSVLRRVIIERRFVAGMTLGDVPSNGSYDGYLLPFIAINAKPDNPTIPFISAKAKTKNKIISGTINHELIHVARFDIYAPNQTFYAKKVHSYEETFASSMIYKFSLGKNRRLIKKAKKTLEGHLEGNVGYVLGRLTYDETKDILNNKSNPIDFIAREAKNALGSGLRLRIIKEKLEKG